jgi:hypothetical protein
MSSPDHDSREVLELSSSPPETNDFSIVNVESVEPIRLDDDIVEISSSATPQSETLASHARPPAVTRRSFGGDDLEITSVEMHARPPSQRRSILNLPDGNMAFFLPGFNEYSDSSSRTPTPPRTTFNVPRSTARPRPSRNSSNNNDSRNRMRDVLLPRFHAVRGALYQFLAGLQSREDDDLQRALRLSAQQYSFPYQGTNNSPNIEDARTLPVPKEVRPGFTRAIDPANTYECAWCRIELNEGIPERTKANEQVWFKSFNGTNDVDRQMSKRIFFSCCGHVYCGWCVKRIVNRPKARAKKKQQPDPTLANSQYIASCCVDGCRKPFRGKFIEIFC